MKQHRWNATEPPLSAGKEGKTASIMWKLWVENSSVMLKKKKKHTACYLYGSTIDDHY